MTVLQIVADQPEATVTRGEPRTIRSSVTGWSGSAAPSASLAVGQNGSPDWFTVEVVAWRDASHFVDVTLDPTRGTRRPRPGTYEVHVSVGNEKQPASTTLRFRVDRHPCLQIGPTPSITWNALSNSVSVGVSVWSCGNVDLTVSWSARVGGRRLEVDPPTLGVSADAGIVDTTLNVRLPDGKVDVETELELAALGEGIEVRPQVLRVPALIKPEPDRRRQWIRRLVVLGVLVALVAAAGVALSARESAEDASTSGAPISIDTAAPAESIPSVSVASPDTPEITLVEPSSADPELTVVETPVTVPGTETSQTADERALPDLRVIVPEAPLRPCLTGPGACLFFMVRNDGDGDSTESVVEVTGPGDEDSRGTVKPVRANTSASVIIEVPNTCGDGCGGAVTIDVDEEVDESNEDNNSDAWSVIG